MPTLTRVFSHQEARTMTAVTRKGATVYVAGSHGDTYELQQITYPDTGEISYTCTCIDYTGTRNGQPFRQSKLDTRQQCKHAPIAANVLNR